MKSQSLTIKELAESVGNQVTPRMVRHYHQIGLMPDPSRSSSNYRLYGDADVQRLRQIVSLKQQGFQLSHIRQLLSADAASIASDTLLLQLQQQYRAAVQQLAQLRYTISALEGILGSDVECQQQRAAAIAQLQQFDVTTQTHLQTLDQLWNQLDAATSKHPETFEESLQRLLPDLSDRSEIEVDLLSKLVLACGDVSLVQFVQMRADTIGTARHALQASCTIVGDVPAVVAALDHPRLAHLGCAITTLIDDPHITSVAEAEQAFWYEAQWHDRLDQIPPGAIIAIGYAPSILMAVCQLIESGKLNPALVIGLPIGFSHAPASKRRLMRSDVPYLTVQGSLDGGLLAAVALNALADSLIEKPDCHCYLNGYLNGAKR